MAGVFLSYDRDDGAAARIIATALEKAGHEVWWDLHVRGGAQFSKVIEEALKAADVVVVLWSVNSVESAWVRDEAAAGRDSGRLVPASLDRTQGPLGFRQFQTIDLTDWKRGARSGGYQALEEAIREAAPQGAATALAVERPRRTVSARAAALLAVPLAGAVAAAAYLLWPQSSTGVPTVTVLPAANNPVAQGFARDLFAKLGSLQASNAKALQLVDQDPAGAADLVFKVDGRNEGNQSRATLVLLRGRDRALLWSKDFDRPSTQQSDLRQQLAYSAAELLFCASETYDPRGKPLDSDTRRLYLNACGLLSDAFAADLNAVVSILREVTRRAPHFEGAWRLIVLLDDGMLFDAPYWGNSPRLRAVVAQDMASLRKLNPDAPEAFVAESNLLPHNRFADRMRLLDLAVERNPESDGALINRSNALMSLGRLNEAVEDARRAMQIGPFSSFTRNAYISALTYAGQFDAAAEELRKADSLWPGARNIAEARYRLNLRYGSAADALKETPQGDSAGVVHKLFLQARLDPTPANVDRALETSRRRFANQPIMAGDYVQSLATFNRKQELFEFLSTWHDPERVRYVTDVLFRPAFRDFWRDPNSMRVAKHLGMLDYWRASGHWPDFCSDPTLPYDCKAGAAKLR